MKKLITTLVLVTIGFSISSAQNFKITFLPGDLLTADGSTLDHTNSTSLGINVFFAQTPSGSFTNQFTDPLSPTADDFASYGGLSWTPMQKSLTAGFELFTTPGWDGISGSAITGSTGNVILIALTTAGSVDTTLAGDDVGFMVSINPLPGIGESTLDMTSFNVIAGQSGSVQMVQAVPEPSSFALLAGCFGLAWVMVRRRS